MPKNIKISQISKPPKTSKSTNIKIHKHQQLQKSKATKYQKPQHQKSPKYQKQPTSKAVKHQKPTQVFKTSISEHQKSLNP